MSQQDACDRNWSKYNKELVKRGTITMWFDESIFNQAALRPHKKRGRPLSYHAALIEAALLLKNVYGLPFRALQGFIHSLFTLMKLTQHVPDYTTLCRRQKGLSIKIVQKKPRTSGIDVIVDSTGLKLVGGGEWCVKKHGKQYQRTWRKVHLAIDGDDLQILSCSLSTSRIQDSDRLDKLLEPITDPINRIIGDGAYDKFSCYELAESRGAQGIFPPQTGARLSEETPYHKKAVSLEAIRQRDKTIKAVRAFGKKGWKTEVNYHRRSLVETTMYRLKKLLGERISAKKVDNQLIELQLRCRVLNKMIELSKAPSVAC